jgi:UDP-N-acetylmuramate dehydrogenase
LEDLSRYTTFRLGGPCERLFDCRTPEQLRDAVAGALGDFLLIGGGSNLLVADEGVAAIVIRYYAEDARIERQDGELVVPGSALLDDVARYAAEQGLDGLICCTGIPGTVGGAIVGNAGAFGEQIGDRVKSVTLMNRHGVLREAAPAQLAFAYRRSGLQESRDIVVSARLALTPGDRGRLRAHRREILELRAAKHPDWRKTPTAGSFFKNVEPTSRAERRQAAGWFLEQAGAKALRVGGARTYERHANIIVADPGCTAADVYELSLRMARSVREKFGFDLQREVRLVGAFAPARKA